MSNYSQRFRVLPIQDVPFESCFISSCKDGKAYQTCTVLKSANDIKSDIHEHTPECHLQIILV